MSAIVHARQWLAALMVLGAVLSACGGNSPAPTLPPPSAEALDFDILAVEGPWLLRVELQLTPEKLPFTLSYDGTASFWVQLDGSLSGSGELTPNIVNSACRAHVNSNRVLTFQVKGYAHGTDEGIHARLELQPESAEADESYVLECGPGGEPSTVTQALFWPALQALGKQELGAFTLEGLRWDVPMRGGEVATLDAQLGTEHGRLTGTVRIERG